MPRSPSLTDAMARRAEVARSAGLVYVADSSTGWTRKRRGRGFSYHDADGRPIRDPGTVARIRALAIPPAWTDVWICPRADGHLQATGRDARGRKQYRYHERWTARRRAENLDRVAEFARALPRIRERCARDLRRRGLPRDKVLAAAVRLLELGHLRVGNHEYARLNRSYGLASLRDRHASVTGDVIRLSFRGKGGRLHVVTVTDRRLARVVHACRSLPGPDLLQYRDAGGRVRRVTARDVNEYLREAAGGEFTAKDFRIWAGTTTALRDLVGHRKVGGPPDRRRVSRALHRAAETLGNTVAVVRTSYVHPVVVEASLDGSLPMDGVPVERAVGELVRRARRSRARATKPAPGRDRGARKA